MPKNLRKKVVFVEITDSVLEEASVLVDDKAWFSILIDKNGVLRYGLKFRNNDPTDLKFMQHHFGGYWWEHPLDSGGNMYYLSIQQHRCRLVLEALRDRMIKKNVISDTLEELFRLIQSNNKQKITEEVMSQRKALVAKMWDQNLQSLGIEKKAKAVSAKSEAHQGH